jgi:hypothetical protein
MNQGGYGGPSLNKRSKQMKHKLFRIAIGVPEGLIALSAIWGGIALLAGTYKDGVLIEAGGRVQFPLEWLQHTPFSDYTIPALITCKSSIPEKKERIRSCLKPITSILLTA